MTEAPGNPDQISNPEQITDSEWRERLTPEQYAVLRQQGTERAYAGEYWDNHDDGMFRCAGCGAELFASDTKFESGSGWPSFDAPIAEGAVTQHVDNSHGMRRVEVRCASCDGHLGHLFDDGPRETTGQRFCINSVSLRLETPDSE
ncbi:MAG: peptide-methionine (R)-S-oxide reductase MsrB [Actinobacteria bacterium]|nr:peptide-methionine (R)-S-oxide reductase MsrB [Actinomycetota bacterium]MSW05888.1 peptide-methionine (R)-S-oxide reductase MsrB [Actinomycetota bacterium]MSX82084.1 peptide-methionine (R)-S-oxide reductase MsrB [Actinomycetota bacterium]MSY06363.1 peptide-methionine (R)-S-oxide reductase MsrB [Actinomycetota bacterium]MSZ29594.1 peptide-methionine (R)-S-oxide reductase MsrB [Actinomycetota bacterium]